MKWHFSPQRNDQVETEVTQRDQFNNDDVAISETIVREAVQNSLDAAASDPGNVRVEFRWLNKNSGLDSKFFRSLFDGQIEHAIASGIDVNIMDFDNPSALVIEDFGTRGLTGSVNKWDEDNFSDFWRRHGKSHKTGKSRGRWGLGKLVYSQTSQIGCFFGATQRAGENSVHVMGQTVLTLREIEGRRYPPHAFFADVENQDDSDARIPVPVTDTKLLEDFRVNFGLKRSGQPGLSVMIPFPNASFSIDKMIEVAIVNYFYPLVTGQLVLVFDDIELNSSNVRDYAKKYASGRLKQIDILFDFINEVFHAEQADHLEMKPSWIDDRKLDEDDFDTATLASIRDKFSKGELVGLRLPVTIQYKNGMNQTSGFSVYVKRPEELVTGIDLYVRGGLTLPQEAKFGDRRALGAMVAEDEAICAFLGDAENAAHTKWLQNAEKLRKNYRGPTYTSDLIKAVRNSVKELYDLLAEVTEEVDEDALRDFFWFEEEKSGRKTKRRKKPVAPSPVPEIPRSQPILSLAKSGDGFTLKSTDEFSDDKLPLEIKIKLAYAIARGNAFNKYSPHDFKLESKKIGTMAEGAKLISGNGNEMVLEVTSLPFQLNVKGFDKNRDLQVKVSR